MFRVLIAAVVSLFWLARAEAAPACNTYTFDGSRFTVCELDSRTQTLQLFLTDDKGAALRSFDNLGRALGSDASKVRFAMNAGMFEADGMPLGLYIENGVQRRPLNTRSGSGNFYMKPNGVFEMNPGGAMKIVTTQDFASRNSQPLWATQSGPMLVIHGALAPQIAEDGPSQRIRNGVGVRSPHIAFFAISDEPVSFGKLARFLRDGMGCRNALYLDGAISSLWAPSLDREDSGAPLGPMLVVTGG
ncbi:MAG: phosphodiester glycosidase family protein [Rhizomicrobium sp.]